MLREAAGRANGLLLTAPTAAEEACWTRPRCCGRPGKGSPVRRPASPLARLAALALLLAPATGSPKQRSEPPPRPALPADQTELFSDTVRTWSLEIPEARWRKLLESPGDKRWAAARLAVDGIPVGVVGVRFKGAAGT